MKMRCAALQLLCTLQMEQMPLGLSRITMRSC